MPLLFSRGELARRLATAVRMKEGAPSPSESDDDLYTRFRAASPPDPISWHPAAGTECSSIN